MYELLTKQKKKKKNVKYFSYYLTIERSKSQSVKTHVIWWGLYV